MADAATTRPRHLHLGSSALAVADELEDQLGAAPRAPLVAKGAPLRGPNLWVGAEAERVGANRAKLGLLGRMAAQRGRTKARFCNVTTPDTPSRKKGSDEEDDGFKERVS